MKKFYMRNENFICENCGKEVLKAKKTARDHCNFCLYSKHVDINPGDRQNTCLGLLMPVSVEKYKKSFKIIYKCERCNKYHKNIMLEDDNMDIIIDLTTKNKF